MTVEEVWQALEEVKDPEIPVVSVVEMGMVRDVALEGETVVVTITPTFAGCPALQVIQTAIEECLREQGAGAVEVHQVLDPPWSSDWISAAGRQKLQAFGLAPPPQHGGLFELTLFETLVCPYCGSHNTTLKNAFGPTLCRAIAYCNDCRQPFEQFKPL